MVSIPEAVIKYYDEWIHKLTIPLVPVIGNDEEISIEDLEARMTPDASAALNELRNLSYCLCLTIPTELMGYSDEDRSVILPLFFAASAYQTVWRDQKIYPLKEHDAFLLAVQNAYDHFEAGSNETIQQV